LPNRVRSLLFWLHLAAGLSGGLIILIMSATGAALALKPQITNWVERDLRVVEPVGQRLPTSELLARAGASSSAAIQGVTVDRDPARAAQVSRARGGSLFVNPYTGEIIGTGSERTAAFFQRLTNWHRWLAAEGDGRQAARAITGAANLAFLFLGMTGLVLWWPRNISARRFAAVLWFRRAGTGRARDFNWHNVIGFWCLPAIIIMTASGAVISYPWASNLVYRVAGSAVPERAGGSGREGAGRSASAPVPASQAIVQNISADVDGWIATASEKMPTWDTLTLRMPPRPGGAVAITLTDGASWNRFARSHLSIDIATGEAVQGKPFDASSRGQKWRGWLRFAHTGELGGLAGQIVAGIGCLGGVLLVYTGISLAIRRLARAAAGVRSRRRSPAPQSIASELT
jgi:uncharacterized iron-regulated membrane protein